MGVEGEKVGLFWEEGGRKREELALSKKDSNWSNFRCKFIEMRSKDVYS